MSRTHSSSTLNVCGAFIPAVVALPVIRDKTVLHILDGIRGAIIDGEGLASVADTLLILLGFGVVMVPGGIAVFAVAERWAKKTGRLKRQG
mgnify:CR=1 FL=1